MLTKIIERVRIERKEEEDLKTFYDRMVDEAIKIAQQNGVPTWISFLYDSNYPRGKKYEAAEICFVRRTEVR